MKTIIEKPFKWHLSEQIYGYSWKHKTYDGALTYDRDFYTLEGEYGLITWLDARYGKRFRVKAIASMLQEANK